MTKIQPLGNIVQIKLDEQKAGVLDTSSRISAVEVGEVVSVGPDVKNLKKGDKVFFKSWGVDSINHGETRYHFISLETNAILAIVK